MTPSPVEMAPSAAVWCALGFLTFLAVAFGVLALSLLTAVAGHLRLLAALLKAGLALNQLQAKQESLSPPRPPLQGTTLASGGGQTVQIFYLPSVEVLPGVQPQMLEEDDEEDDDGGYGGDDADSDFQGGRL